MMQVWFLFKILETVLGTICMVFHAQGFLDKEPIPHILLFCGTFFGFTLFSFIGAIGIAVGGSPPPLVECATNFCATIMYVTASVVSMHHAENDFHLMYLSDFEEPLHPYFSNCRAQSIAALATGSIHLLHSVLAFDVLFVPKRASFESRNSDSDPEDGQDETFSDERRPIKMYFMSKFIERKLRQNEWFDNMCRRPSAPLTIYSAMPISSRRVSNIHGMANFADLEKNRKSGKTYEEYKPSAKTKAKSETQESLTSEELKDSLHYKDFPSSPHASLGDSKPFEVVNEKKDQSSSQSESKFTRFNLQQKVSSSEIPAEGQRQSQQDQKLHSILKRDSEDTKTETAIDPTAQQPKLQRTSSQEARQALLKAEPQQVPRLASKEVPARETLPESKPELELKTSSHTQRSSSQEDMHAFLKGGPKKEEESAKLPSQDTLKTSSQEEIRNLLKAAPPTLIRVEPQEESSSVPEPKAGQSEQPSGTASKEALQKPEAEALSQPPRIFSQEALHALLQPPPQPSRTSSQEDIQKLLQSPSETSQKPLQSQPEAKKDLKAEPSLHPSWTSSQEALQASLNPATTDKIAPRYDDKDDKTDPELVAPSPAVAQSSAIHKSTSKKKSPKRDSSTQTVGLWSDEPYDESSILSTEKDQESTTSSTKDKTPSENETSNRRKIKRTQPIAIVKTKTALPAVGSVDAATETESSEPHETELNKNPSDLNKMGALVSKKATEDVPQSTPPVPQTSTAPQNQSPLPKEGTQASESTPRKKHKSNEPKVDTSQQTPPEFDVSDSDVSKSMSHDK